MTMDTGTVFHEVSGLSTCLEGAWKHTHNEELLPDMKGALTELWRVHTED